MTTFNFTCEITGEEDMTYKILVSGTNIKTVNTNTLLGSGDLTITGASSVVAYVNFDGTGSTTVRKSFNVSSITKNGTGDYTINFTTPMADTNYLVFVGQTPAIGVSSTVGLWWGGVAVNGSDVPILKTVNAVNIKTAYLNGPGQITDAKEIYVSIVS
jgi:hypothetical protein